MLTQKKLQVDGYMTVFLSLTITIIMSLILTLFYGARISAMKMRAECVADISFNSALAEYGRELYRQYDLLMIDTSYGTSNPSISNTESRIDYYTGKNFKRSTVGVFSGSVNYSRLRCNEPVISEYSLALDGRGAVLRRQILAYMTAEPIEGMMADAADNVTILQNNGFDTRDVEAEAEAVQEEINEIDLPVRTLEDGTEEEVALDNPADDVNGKKGIGILNLVISNPETLSLAGICKSDYVSSRNKMKGTGLDDSEELSPVDLLLIDQYMFEKCGFYGKETEKSRLKYQMEYILFGESTDRENLEKTAGRLLFWREASNIVYIMSDSTKVAEAEAVAALLTAVILQPELLELVKLSILFAWSFAESISDLKILFNGGRVPLIKTSDTWKLSLEGMATFGNADEGSGEGLNYEEYLRMMVLMKSVYDKTEGLADIIEMDIRKTQGNSGFRIDACLDCFIGEMIFENKNGFRHSVRRKMGYEMSDSEKE